MRVRIDLSARSWSQRLLLLIAIDGGEWRLAAA
jgi:hypothetical protein